jgi:F-type H+-transporting ATPase subunit delta
MIRTTKQAKREAKQLLGLCLIDGQLDHARARKVVQATIQCGHRGYLMVLRYFHRLLKLEMARHTAEVESVVPLPADLQADVQNHLEGLYGSGITTFFGLNPELIGGMRIKIGNDVYDGSVRFRLASLARGFGITGENGRKAKI